MTHETWTCRRCGECCRRGGPALHEQDLPLITDVVLPLDALLTLRRGELARDQVQGALAPLEEEIVKLKPQGTGWTCGKLHMLDNMCAIYENRPAECRAMVCEDTAELEAMYAQDRITRADVIGQGTPLAELVETHEERCSVALLRRLAECFLDAEKEQKAQAADAILEIIAYDRAVRELAREKGQIRSGMLDFLFGRPVERILPGVGLRVQRAGGKLTLVAAPVEEAVANLAGE